VCSSKSKIIFMANNYNDEITVLHLFVNHMFNTKIKNSDGNNLKVS